MPCCDVAMKLRISSRNFLFDFFDSLGQVQSALIDDAVDVFHRLNLFGLETTARHTDDIDAAILYRRATSVCEWRHVLVDARHAGGHRVFANHRELRYARAAADDCPIVDVNLARYLCGVAHHDFVAEHTVVSDVAVRHNEVVGAYYGLALGRRATVEGYALADGVVVANFECGVFAHKLQVLRHCTDGRARENTVVFAEARAGEDVDVADNLAAVAYLHVVVDDAKGANLNVLADFGVGVYFG